MQADVYRQTQTQDDSGQILRDWALLDTIKCFVRPLALTGRASDNERWDSEYRYDLTAVMSTMFDFELGDRVANILDADATLIWKESIGQATVFDVVRISPVPDPFGRMLEYSVNMIRSEVQDLG